MLARLRPVWNKFIAPLGNFSSKVGISANTWTLFSLLCSLVGSIYLYYGQFWMGLIWIIIMLIADMLDGATARAAGTASKFGMVLDHVIDRYAEFIIFAGLLMGDWITPFTGLFAISGIIMASYVRAKAESAGGIKDCAVGIAGRVEKILLTYGAILFLAIGVKVWAEYFFIVIGLISHVTALQRLLYTKSTNEVETDVVG
jgi:CDP-diacylglycerol--glycerol-3-phosphate 3-phosphatidyltransferase/archaetidylinositol phosphate synthase